ncbi:MAG: M48 family metallopeptidase [Candidatus Omnitrophica bacterium]|nr:M48 family metallopeptidase [Candidatus Omnitrophota bacterium]MCM8803148.1 M48 family metallopeptidase [Candidatus Omnitrophota bacterium]
MKKLIGIVLVFFILSGCTPVLKQPQLSKEEIETEREKQQEIAINTYIERKIRLYKVGLPLLKGALNFYNKKPVISLGILVHTEKNYKKEYLPILRKKYRVEETPTILYIHPDFGAYSSGLKVNDRIIEIDKKKITSLESLKKTLQEIDINKEKVEVIVDRNGEDLKFNVQTTKICPFSFVLYSDPRIGDTINAFTDGQIIYATPGLLRFIQQDKELAFILSHEIAHAVLDHVQKTLGNRILGTIVDIAITVATGISTQGIFGDLAGLVFSKEFEKEADYLGTYIAAISGYDISDAPDFWRKMAAEYPGSTKDVFLATHPSSPERYILIEKTVSEIKEKQEKGLPLSPDFKKVK